MLSIQFFTWWYGRGWLLLAHTAQKRLLRTSHLFSLPILVRTLFVPWRRIVTYPGAGLQARLRAASDNLMSRVIGFIVRVLVLIAALIILVVVLLIGLGELIVWPLVPVLAAAALVKGVVG